MDAVTNVPPPHQRAGPAPTPRAAPSGRALEAQGQGAGRRAGRADHDDRRPAADGRRRAGSTWCSRTTTGTCSATCGNATDAGRGRRGRGGPGGRAGWRALSFDDRAAIFLQGRRPAGRPVAGHAQRGHHARPVQDAVPGRDRRRLRADRLPALQRALRAAAAGRAAAVRRPGCGTGSTTGRSRASCCAITPFNFTSIAGNLPTAPALMGNTVVWKPSPTQQLAAHYTMRLLEAAGLPPGVINLVTGDGAGGVPRSRCRTRTWPASTSPAPPATFQHLWRTVGENIAGYRGYPRLVGETGGKDFVIAHPSRRPGRCWPPR